MLIRPMTIDAQSLEELQMLRAKVARLEQAEAESKRTAALLAGQKRVLEMIATGAALSEVLTVLIQVIENQSPQMLCSILLVDQAGVNLRHGAAPSLPQSFNEAIDGMAIGPDIGSCGTSAYFSKPISVSNIATSPLWADFREIALDYNLQACWSYPIFATNGKVLGTFGVYYNTPRDPAPVDLQLIEVATHIAGIVIERKCDEEALQESESRHRFLAEAVPQLVWATQPNGETDYFNERWYSYTAQTKEQASGQGWLKVVHPDDLAQTVEAWNKAVQTGEPYQTEYRLRRFDGVYRWFLARGLPFKNEQDQVTNWYGTSTDIDDQKQLDNLKDLFVSIASHELRTPLTLVNGYAQALRRNVAKQRDSKTDPANLEKFLDKSLRSVSNIIEQADQIDDLIRQLLDFSRVQNGKLELDYSQDVNLIELVQRVVEQQSQITQDHTLKLQVSQSSVIGTFDKGRIKQVLNNLISNAVKYSPANTDVLVGVEQQAETVLVWVRDHGYGINFADQNHIFDSFYRVRTRQNRRVEGLGLGLYITHDIVVQHGGRIWLESKPGEGSTFYIILPLAQS